MDSSLLSSYALTSRYLNFQTNSDGAKNVRDGKVLALFGFNTSYNAPWNCNYTLCVILFLWW